MKVPLAVLGLRELDIKMAIQVLESGKLTMGSMVKEFESQMAAYLKVDHFIMVNSGSSANLLMIESLLRPSQGNPYLKAGDGVLVPAIAWPTTVWPLLQLGLKPIFVDVNRDNFSIDLDAAHIAIRKSSIPVKAIFPIHPLGAGLQHSILDKFCKSTGLLQISDVCESLGSWTDGVHAGTGSLCSSFSFYFSHHITTMEGGGIATNNGAIADDLISMRSHGWSRDRSDSSRWNQNISTPESKFQFISTGYNVRPMEIQAAIGINQIKNIEDFITKRRILADNVSRVIAGSSVKICGVNVGEELLSKRNHSWMMIPLDVSSSTKTKAEIQSFLEERGIETRPVLTGNFLRQPAMVARPELGSTDIFPNADWVSENCFLIGAHHDYSVEQVDHLTNTLLDLVKYAERV